MTNTLQKKLDQVKREKALLEQQIEREESSHGKLKTKLTTMHATMEELQENKSSSDEEKVDSSHGGENQHPATILESEDEGEEEEEVDNERK